MTKAELIEKLDGLPDDTTIYIPSICPPGDFVTAKYIEVINVCGKYYVTLIG